MLNCYRLAWKGLAGCIFFVEMPEAVMYWISNPAESERGSLLHKILLLVTGIHLAASSLVSATIRMFRILFPILAAWPGYVASKTIRFHMPAQE